MKVRVINNLGELFDFSKEEVQKAESYITEDGAKLTAITIKAPNVIGCITEAIAALFEVIPEGDRTLYLMNGESRTSAAGSSLHLVMGISGVLDLGERLAARSGMNKGEEISDASIVEKSEGGIELVEAVADSAVDVKEEDAVVVE